MKTFKSFILVVFTFVLILGSFPSEVQANGITKETLNFHGVRSRMNKRQKKVFNNYLKQLKKINKQKNIKFSDEIVLARGKFTNKEIQDLDVIIADEYFGVYGDTFIFYNDIGNGNKEITMFDPKSDIKNYRKNEKYKKVIAKKARSLVSRGMNERTASNRIQKWICKHVSYRVNNLGKADTGDAWTAYSKRRARCEGYAQLYKAMCDSVGIKCEYVAGKANGEGGWGEHAWNRVRINGHWYYTDVTWLDGCGLNSKYKYSRKLWKDHKIYTQHCIRLCATQSV